MTACPACATPAAPSARFCGACGTALPVELPQLRRRHRRRARRSAPTAAPRLASTAGGGRRRSDERRRGEERRVVSVLFVDVVGWTSAAEQLDPEDLRAAQSDYFAAVRTVIEESGGTLEKYIGDAVLACFGAPRATEDDALRAVRAALAASRTRLDELVVGDEPLEARIGVATAEALVDLDADPARGQAFVTGDVVNLASRLQSAAPGGGVLVGASPRMRRPRNRSSTSRSGPLTLKGKAEPVEAFLALEHVGQGALPGRATTCRSSGAAPQLRLLESCLDRAIGDGAGALVTITGEPGIGKSRLVHELRRRGRRAERSGEGADPGCAGCRRRASPSTTRAAIAPLAALLSSWSGISDVTAPGRGRRQADRADRRAAPAARHPADRRGAQPAARATPARPAGSTAAPAPPGPPPPGAGS